MNIRDELEKDLLELDAKERNIKKKMFRSKKGLYEKIQNRLKDYDPNIKVLPIKYRGKNVLRIRIRADKYSSNRYSRIKIQNIGNDLSSYLKSNKISGVMMTSLLFPNPNKDIKKLGFFRSGYFTPMGSPTHLYEFSDSDLDYFEEPKEFPEFDMYICEHYGHGGSDKNNDCLYNCLKIALQDDLTFNSGFTFKKFLKLDRNDKVPIQMIPVIEQKLKGYGINISGDYTYTSVVKTHKIINLKFVIL